MYRRALILAAMCCSLHSVVQAGDQRCGAVALAICLNRLGCPADAHAIAERLPNAGEYSSLGELAAVAREYDFAARGMQWSDQIPAGAPPAIVPIASAGDRLHFVAILETRDDQMLVRDGHDEGWVFATELIRAGWDGRALHIARDEAELAPLVPPRWSTEQLIYVAAAGLFSAAGFIVWPSVRRGVLP